MRTLTLLALFTAACNSGSAILRDLGDSETDADADSDTDSDADADTDTDSDADPTDDQDQDGFSIEDGDCNDLDPEIFPTAPEAWDLVDNDCDGLVDEDFIAEGDLILNEVMQTPAAVDQSAGEWFELQNVTANAIDIQGWVITDGSSESFQIVGSLVIESKDYVVLGASAADNGGVTPAYVYDYNTFTLNDVYDSILVTMGGTLITSVTYTEDYPLERGSSLSLDPSRKTQLDDPTSWCTSPKTMSGGDMGSPSGYNGYCGHIDHDLDGYSGDEGDCDDTDASTYPGASEAWDGVDNDCNGITDELSTSDATGWLDGVDTDYLGYRNGIALGDVNGDGQVDLVVGGTYVNTNSRGGLYILDGSDASSWAGAVTNFDDSTVDGSSYYNYWGTTGQHLGDQDGDGIDDLVGVGTDYYYSYYYGQPAGALFFGSSWGIAGGEASDGDITFSGTDSQGAYVSVLSDADFDGDGLDDVVISDWYAGSSYRGHVYVELSKDLSSGDYDLADSASGEVYGEESNDYLGWSLAAADVDGDGADDLFISAPGADTGASGGGCLYEISGASISGDQSIGSVANLTICSPTTDARLGRNAAPQLADFDGDGAIDLAISAPGADAVYLFFNVGSLSGSVRTTAADLVITGTGSPDYFGFSMATGDFDGDGLADLAISAPDATDYNSSPNDEGIVYVFSGSAMSIATTMDTTDATTTITSSTTDAFGMSMVAGDLNGDGIDDLLVSAPRHSSGYGRVYLFVKP